MIYGFCYLLKITQIINNEIFIGLYYSKNQTIGVKYMREITFSMLVALQHSANPHLLCSSILLVILS